MGNEFEPIILARAEKLIGKIEPNVTCAPDDKTLPFESNVDGIALEKDDCPVEAKSSGVFWPVLEIWGEPGSDQVSHRVTIQCHMHMICTGKELCYVSVLLWGLKSALYVVPYDKEIGNMIIEKGQAFWVNHVMADIPPEDSVPSLDIIRRIKREPDVVVELTSDVVANWMASRDTRLAAEKTEKADKGMLIAALGDAEGGRCSQGLVTFFQQTQNRIDGDKIKELFPGQYMKTLKFRKLAFKANIK